MRITFCFLLFLVFIACQPTFEEPKIPLDAYRIEEGFNLEVIASEPLLKAPVAIDFDAKGRIWVAEMTEFMSDIDGEKEDNPTGTIKILEDLDKDGVMDHSKVFLNSLVLPRALAFAYGGLLYAEPPNLWFVEIENDKPKNRVLVDSLYAAEGNPEHQPNGLMMNVDNWIYNAKSHFRYQRKNGEWIKEPTSFRGQWGISQDNFGRLYYNDNTRQLIGDYMLPNRLTRNQNHIPKSGISELLTKDQRVYPLHAAAVNRGYAKGI
ncbi:MAG: dehydrogenase, partial [Maribacter sp.]|nr:dehydrogenase [Maribacter sp.]